MWTDFAHDPVHVPTPSFCRQDGIGRAVFSTFPHQQAVRCPAIQHRNWRMIMLGGNLKTAYDTSRKGGVMLLDTPICDFGWQAPRFTLKDPAGTPFAMQDHLGQHGLLIAFICNHCPYVKAIAGRLADDGKTLMGEGVGVLAIMSNDYRAVPADSPANMARFAAEHGFAFPYLVDEEQSVGRAYGAVCTPDFFGFNKEGALQYRGRLDDAGRGDASRRTPELLSAMRQIARTGQGPRDQTPAMGCSIKWR